MIKLQVKGITISHSSYKKRLKGREENNAEEQTAKLQKALDENPTNGVREEIHSPREIISTAGKTGYDARWKRKQS